MLELTDAIIIGKGTERICYIHPKDSSLCVKINHSQENKQSKKEVAYCEMLITQGKLPCKSIPQFHGTVTTNLGQGIVFERVKNFNNEAVQSLADALPVLVEVNDITTLSKILTALDELKNDLLNHCILVRDLTLKNIYIKHLEHDEIKLMLVDGFGNSDFIPIANYVKIYARLKINKRFKRLKKKILKTYPKNTTVISMMGTPE